MEYLPGMEQIQSDVRANVMGQVNAFDPSQYTAKDVKADRQVNLINQNLDEIPGRKPFVGADGRSERHNRSRSGIHKVTGNVEITQGRYAAPQYQRRKDCGRSRPDCPACP